MNQWVFGRRCSLFMVARCKASWFEMLTLSVQFCWATGDAACPPDMDSGSCQWELYRLRRLAIFLIRRFR